MPIDYAALRPELLQAFHEAIRNCLLHDRNRLRPDDVYYGAEEFPDWRQQAAVIESEMLSRGIPFLPIDW